jgi:hypothetical protein
MILLLGEFYWTVNRYISYLKKMGKIKYLPVISFEMNKDQPKRKIKILKYEEKLLFTYKGF